METLEETYQKNLIIRLTQSDEAAFNTLYQFYSKPLYLRILYLVKDEDIADEILQDLFLKVWNIRATLNSEKSFRAYLYKIAQNLVYNHFRKIAGERLMIQALLQQDDLFHSAEDSASITENKDAGQLLQEAIYALSPQRRRVFELCKIEGKSYDEASRILGISVATVNSHMTKSIRHIRDHVMKHQHLCYLLLAVYLKSKQ